MRGVTIILFVLVSFKLFGQDKGLVVVGADTVVGKCYLENKDLVAKTKIFSSRIVDYYIDTLNNYSIVKVRMISKNGKFFKNTGFIICYNLDNYVIRWKKEIGFQNEDYSFYPNYILHSNAFMCSGLNVLNGDVAWELPCRFFYIDRAKNIGIGYKISNYDGLTNILQGVDLFSGKVLWKRKVEREFNWNEAISLNDSSLLVVSSGLHTVNYSNGLGWDYNAVTGRNDYSKAVLTSTAGVALGVLTGVGFYNTSPDQVVDIVSNVVIDSTAIYFASQDKLSCVDRISGKELWASVLPPKHSSRSTLEMRDSMLYLINYGHATKGRELVEYGKPFVASFSKATGQKILLKQIGLESDYIVDFKHKEDSLTLLSSRELSRYFLKDDSLVLEKRFRKDSVDGFKSFLGSNLFQMVNDTLFTPLTYKNRSESVVLTQNNNILKFESDIDKHSLVDMDSLYFIYFLIGKNVIVSNGRNAYVLNPDFKRIGTLSVSSDAKLIGTTLYDIQANSLLEVDLSVFFPTKSDL